MAEFLVYSSLNQITLSNMQMRENWLPFDMTSASGRKIEVKSASYIQTWTPENIFSQIRFDIEKNWHGIMLLPLQLLSQNAIAICTYSAYLLLRQKTFPCLIWIIGTFMCYLHPFWIKSSLTRKELFCPHSLN